MTSTRLFDVVVALNAKIQAAAESASPEELAYLGSALEKIGGPLSMADLADFVQTLKDKLQRDAEAVHALALSTITESAESAAATASAAASSNLSAMLEMVKDELANSDEALNGLHAAIDAAVAAAIDLRAAVGTSNGKLFFFQSF